ncbi:MAG: helix-turn-helix domain-containing protein [Acidobacteriota bacterium]|nr:helix-turn-helix domain-containing protein [Acidobacteriota bacterium]
MLEQSGHSPESPLRQKPTNSVELYDDGFLRVEHSHYFVTCGGINIKLGRAEFLIVSILVQNANRFIAGEVIWNHVWKGKRPFNQESLKVFIYNLRRQFAPFGITIETMIKVGYKLIPDEKSSEI